MGLEIKAKLRKSTGKGVSRKLRSSGSVPGVLYGYHCEPVAISLDAREASMLNQSKLHRRIHNLKIQDLQEDIDYPFLLKDVQINPLTNQIVHVDLYRITKGQILSVLLPLHLVGKPIGVTDQGGSLQFVTRQVNVRCLPEAMPERIEVPIDKMQINESLYIRDLQLPEGLTISDDSGKVIVSVVTIKAAKTEETGQEVAEVAEEAEVKSPAESEK